MMLPMGKERRIFAEDREKEWENMKNWFKIHSMQERKSETDSYQEFQSKLKESLEIKTKCKGEKDRMLAEDGEKERENMKNWFWKESQRDPEERQRFPITLEESIKMKHEREIQIKAQRKEASRERKDSRLEHYFGYNGIIPLHDKRYLEKQAESCIDYTCDHEITKQGFTIHHLPDCIMIKIFGKLSMSVLTKISRTCKTWRRLSLDRYLWKTVDLTPFRYQLNDYKIVQIIRSFLMGSIRTLSIGEFSISAQILRELAKCRTLRSLNLDSCTFVGKFNENCLNKAFPSNLSTLSMRHTSGATSVMKVVCPRLVSVCEFHASNSVIDDCDIVELISSLQSIKTLKISNSANIDKTALQLMARHCNNLRCLSLKHCCNFTGEGLQELVNQCTELLELSFNGTELQDRFLMNVNWRKSSIRKLEISWCRNVTERGLRSIICKLSDLEYLKVCSCGNGHALTDNLMQYMATSSTLLNLKEIEFSFSRDLTDEGILTLTRHLRSLKYLSVSHCSQLTPQLLSTINKSSEMFITVTFSTSNPDEFTSFGRTYFKRTGERSYS